MNYKINSTSDQHPLNRQSKVSLQCLVRFSPFYEGPLPSEDYKYGPVKNVHTLKGDTCNLLHW